jgi:hypothetical protein
MRILRGWISVGIHDAQSEQIEFSTAVHGALDQLQAVNMSFDWTVAPRLLKGGKQRGFIVAEVFCEACQQAAFCAVLPVGPSSSRPVVESCGRTPAPDQRRLRSRATGDIVQRCSCGHLLAPSGDSKLFAVGTKAAAKKRSLLPYAVAS